MINTAYKIELPSDDGTKYFRCHRYYKQNGGGGHAFFGVSRWVGQLYNRTEQGDKFIRSFSFWTKKQVLTFLRTHVEFEKTALML